METGPELARGSAHDSCLVRMGLLAQWRYHLCHEKRTSLESRSWVVVARLQSGLVCSQHSVPPDLAS